MGTAPLRLSAGGLPSRQLERKRPAASTSVSRAGRPLPVAVMANASRAMDSEGRGDQESMELNCPFKQGSLSLLTCLTFGSAVEGVIFKMDFPCPQQGREQTTRGAWGARGGRSSSRCR